MTDTGTFIINGAERVIVSQLVRSPGVYYKKERDAFDKEIYSAQLIPNRGAWIELESDPSGSISVRIDRNRKMPVTVLVRALGYSSNEEILDLSIMISTLKGRWRRIIPRTASPLSLKSTTSCAPVNRLRKNPVLRCLTISSMIPAVTTWPR